MGMGEKMYGGYDVPEYTNNEENWRNGFHVTQKEKTIKLVDMDDLHLKHTIRYFKGMDTIPLEKELSKRLNKK